MEVANRLGTDTGPGSDLYPMSTKDWLRTLATEAEGARKTDASMRERALVRAGIADGIEVAEKVGAASALAGQSRFTVSRSVSDELCDDIVRRVDRTHPR